jgi:hypothetical protein
VRGGQAGFIPAVRDVLIGYLRGEEKYSENPDRGKERRRVGEADPPMRENRQVFPHTSGYRWWPGSELTFGLALGPGPN